MGIFCFIVVVCSASERTVLDKVISLSLECLYEPLLCIEFDITTKTEIAREFYVAI